MEMLSGSQFVSLMRSIPSEALNLTLRIPGMDPALVVNATEGIAGGLPPLTGQGASSGLLQILGPAPPWPQAVLDLGHLRNVSVSGAMLFLCVVSDQKATRSEQKAKAQTSAQACGGVLHAPMHYLAWAGCRHAGVQSYTPP